MSWTNVKSSVQNSIKQNGSGAITGNLLQGVLLTICNEAAVGIGPQGKSAYQVWLDEGNVGTVSGFFASLKGETGDNVSLRKTTAGIEWKLSSQPDTAYQVLVTIDELKLHFSDLTAADIATLQQPATNAADALTIYVQQKDQVLTQLQQDTESARQGAVTATTNVQSATTAATNATTAADQATTNATAATTAASTAASTANQSAIEANAARDTANTAATSANNAADSANQAATNANNATQSATTAATKAEELNANQPKIITGEWWAYDPATHIYINTGLRARGPEGKGPVVLANGNYGNWDETAQTYLDTGIVAAATINLEDFPVSFTEAATRETINSEETVPAVFGKLKKWFSDLGALAWKSKADYQNDIENLPVFKQIFGESVLGAGDIAPENVKDIIYNSSAETFTVSYYGGRLDETISMPADNFLANASYDGVTHILTLTMSNNSQVQIPLDDLINEYKAANDGGLEVINGNEFKLTDGLKNKIDGIEAGAQKNVQVDWVQTNTSADDYINNKPLIPIPRYGTLTVQVDGIDIDTFTSDTSSTINLTGLKNNPKLDDLSWNDTTGVIVVSYSDAIPNTTRIYIHKTDGNNIAGTIGGTGGSGSMSSSGVVLTVVSSTSLSFTPSLAEDVLDEEWVLSIR